MNPIQGNTNLYSAQIGYGVPLSTGGVATEALLPTYNSVITDSIMPPKTSTTTAMKSDSGLTYNVPISLPRKRSRDSINNISPPFSYPTAPANYKNSCGPFSFLGEDISLRIQQEQFDIDRLISQHVRTKYRATKTMRFGVFFFLMGIFIFHFIDLGFSCFGIL